MKGRHLMGKVTPFSFINLPAPAGFSHGGPYETNIDDPGKRIRNDLVRLHDCERRSVSASAAGAAIYRSKRCDPSAATKQTDRAALPPEGKREEIARLAT